MIKSKTELKNKMDQITNDALNKLALEVQMLWENYIERRFYNLYKPKVYKRTYQLLNSVVVTSISKIGNVWIVEIFMDEQTATRGYKDHSAEYVWDIASKGDHYSSEIHTEGEFYNELVQELRSGRFYDDFYSILHKELGLNLKRK